MCAFGLFEENKNVGEKKLNIQTSLQQLKKFHKSDSSVIIAEDILKNVFGIQASLRYSASVLILCQCPAGTLFMSEMAQSHCVAFISSGSIFLTGENNSF